MDDLIKFKVGDKITFAHGDEPSYASKFLVTAVEKRGFMVKFIDKKGSISEERIRMYERIMFAWMGFGRHCTKYKIRLG